MSDKLEQMFELRKRWMLALAAKRGERSNPLEPLDLTKKDAQRHLRDVSLRGVEEVFEALGLLRNWKPHRETDIPEFDSEKFLEEYVDALNFFLTVLIEAGFSADDLHRKYIEKDAIIHERLRTGY